MLFAWQLLQVNIPVHNPLLNKKKSKWGLFFNACESSLLCIVTLISLTAIMALCYTQ